jgi:hypothetical protein
MLHVNDRIRQLTNPISHLIPNPIPPALATTYSPVVKNSMSSSALVRALGETTTKAAIVGLGEMAMEFFINDRKFTIIFFGIRIPAWAAAGVQGALMSYVSDSIGNYAIPTLAGMVSSQPELQKGIKWATPPLIQGAGSALAKQYLFKGDYDGFVQEAWKSGLIKLVADGAVEVWF